MIPPGIPGVVELPPGGAEPAPARARELVGSRRVTLDLIHIPDNPEQARVAELVRQSLARAGIKLRIRTHPEALSIAADPAEGIDLILAGWAADLPDPANAVAAAVTQLRPPGTDPPPWLEATEAATRVTGPSRVPTFRALDRRLSEVDIPLVPYAVQLGRPVFFSERVGCQSFLPLFEGLPNLGALCLRDQDGAEPSSSSGGSDGGG